MLLATVARRLPVFLFGLLTLGLSGGAAAQVAGAAARYCSLAALDPDARSQQATLVVEGEVLSAEGFWDARQQRIYTAHRVRVFRGFKGGTPAEVRVLTEGGTVGADQQELTNTLRLGVGDQGIFFLRPGSWAGTGSGWVAYGSQQGFIRYDLPTLSAAEPFRQYPEIGPALYAEISARTGQQPQVVAPNPALAARLRLKTLPAHKGQAPVIVSLQPLTLTAGATDVLTISGSGFGTTQGSGFVSFRNADDGGATFINPQPSDYVSWSDTRIQVRVPSYGTAGNPAGTGAVRVTTAGQLSAVSAQVVTIIYALSNVQDRTSKAIVRPRHGNLNGSGGLTFQLEAGFAGNTDAAQTFQRALLQTWRCQTGVNWTLGPVRNGQGAADDGMSSVGFDSGSELPTGVLGRTTSYYRGCVGARGELEFYVKEIDMQFDDGINFLFALGTPGIGQFDFESVVVHELGHAQQLSHVILPRAVMHFGVAPRQVKRELGPDDITGARLVLRTRSFVAPACGAGAMLPAPLTTQTARSLGATTEVTWTTRDECFLQEFVVERAADTTAWETVGTVPAGAGPSYRFVDVRPLPQLSYYRLRLRRPDGSLDTAVPLAVSAEAAATDQLIVFPNPIQSGQLRLQFPSAAAGTLTVLLYDAVGRYRSGQVVDVDAGLNIRSMNVDNLPPGWYLLRWRDDNGRTGSAPFIRVR